MATPPIGTDFAPWFGSDGLISVERSGKMPYLMVVAFVCLLWFIFYMALYTIQQAQKRWKRKRRLQHRIGRIVRTSS
jgi:hypothetical protein